MKNISLANSGFLWRKNPHEKEEEETFMCGLLVSKAFTMMLWVELDYVVDLEC